MVALQRDRIEWLSAHILPYEGELRSWLARQSLGALEVDDVVQDAYAALIALGTVDHIAMPRRYFFEVAKSIILKSLRRAPLVSLEAILETEGREFPSADPGPDTIVASRNELRLVAELIDQLPPKCREAFVLRKVRGLSQREAARHMDISENTIEKHIGKALALLALAVGRNEPASKSSRSRERPDFGFGPEISAQGNQHRSH